MRRVLHLKMVTQCAMLEEFGIFLVLADKVCSHSVVNGRMDSPFLSKSLFAYHIEALVPSSPQSQHASATPQKLNGNRDVQFFSIGQLHGRTLVIYMKKKGVHHKLHPRRKVDPFIRSTAYFMWWNLWQTKLTNGRRHLQALDLALAWFLARQIGLEITENSSYRQKHTTLSSSRPRLRSCAIGVSKSWI